MELAGYLAKHPTRLDYAARLADGRSIGSGLVEGSIKQLVNLRMKRTGARCQTAHVGPLAELIALADTPEWQTLCDIPPKVPNSKGTPPGGGARPFSRGAGPGAWGRASRLPAEGLERQPVHQGHELLGHRLQSSSEAGGLLQLAGGGAVFHFRGDGAGGGGEHPDRSGDLVCRLAEPGRVSRADGLANGSQVIRHVGPKHLTDLFQGGRVPPPQAASSTRGASKFPRGGPAGGSDPATRPNASHRSAAWTGFARKSSMPEARQR